MYKATPRAIPASIDPIAMFPELKAVHAKLVPGVLKIGRRLTIKVVDLADASIVYQQHRDESGEGGSTFPDGIVTLHGKNYRISYNGRVWAGTKYVAGAQPIMEAQ